MSLRVGLERSDTITCRRGVRQGDPTLPHLFSAVIDWAIDQEAVIGTERVNVCAFADDLVLIARTLAGLQALLGTLSHEFALAELAISAGPNGQSASLRIDIDSKAKHWVVNPVPYLRIPDKAGDSGMIPATSAS